VLLRTSLYMCKIWSGDYYQSLCVSAFNVNLLNTHSVDIWTEYKHFTNYQIRRKSAKPFTCQRGVKIKRTLKSLPLDYRMFKIYFSIKNLTVVLSFHHHYTLLYIRGVAIK
jgi:hypothetical protein